MCRVLLHLRNTSEGRRRARSCQHTTPRALNSSEFEPWKYIGTTGTSSCSMSLHYRGLPGRSSRRRCPLSFDTAPAGKKPYGYSRRTCTMASLMPRIDTAFGGGPSLARASTAMKLAHGREVVQKHIHHDLVVWPSRGHKVYEAYAVEGAEGVVAHRDEGNALAEGESSTLSLSTRRSC